MKEVDINEDQDYLNFINSGNEIIDFNKEFDYDYYIKKSYGIITKEDDEKINYKYDRKLFMRKRLDIKTKAFKDIKYLELEYHVKNKNYFNNKLK